jgi:hypothetical protein
VKEELFTITLRPVPSDIPVEIRLRRALKILLRSCDLRCVAIEQAANPRQSNVDARSVAKPASVPEKPERTP